MFADDGTRPGTLVKTVLIRPIPTHIKFYSIYLLCWQVVLLPIFILSWILCKTVFAHTLLYFLKKIMSIINM